MNWSEVIADPSLHDLPYRIEMNGYGQIVMTPISNRHGMTLSQLANALHECSDSGQITIACSVATGDGVKVADVAWYSDQFFNTHGDSTPYEQAPELCIEVVSPSNSRREMEEKIQLYYDQGAHEVWLCSEAGTLEFFSPAGSLETSTLFPKFPSAIK